MGSKAYHDKEWLKQQYYENNLTLEQIGDKCDVTATTISDWMERHEMPRRDFKSAQQADGKYTGKAWLVQEYVDKERTMRSIGNECGVSPATILKWLRRHGIESRTATEHLKKDTVTFVQLRRGYVRATAKRPNGVDQDYCMVHQLVAIADGADPHKVFSNGDYHVHHKNEVPWDNRPDNLELLSSSDHAKLHGQKRNCAEGCETV